jgi:signal transduction histidine kinase
MPVRLRITLLFVLLVFIILGIVCGSIYYFSYSERLNSIKKRLTNRAITTGRLFSKKEIFYKPTLRQIDSLTTLSLKDKVVQVYDSNSRKIYTYSDLPGDSLHVDPKIIHEVKKTKSHFFTSGNKEAIAYHYFEKDMDMVIISAANDEDGKENLLHLRNILMLSFFWGIIVTMLVGYLFSGKLLSPIKKITDDVSEISMQDLTRRVSTGSVKDEWFNLANTFNQLLNQLQEGFELQRRFIANASHELSTPLTSISSQLEITLENKRTHEEYRDVIQSVYNDVRHMGKLTQTLLEFARASGNKGGLEINLIRIDEIILRLPSEVAKISKDYSVVLNFGELPENEERLLVFGNETLLLTAIKNIVLNACKYSFSRRANIFLKAEEKNIVILIEDKGVGIPADEIENIFQPFYRVDDYRMEAGFGLGLSMAQRIIKLHKGNISVKSLVGEGTTFTITLPSATNITSLY